MMGLQKTYPNCKIPEHVDGCHKMQLKGLQSLRGSGTSHMAPEARMRVRALSFVL